VMPRSRRVKIDIVGLLDGATTEKIHVLLEQDAAGRWYFDVRPFRRRVGWRLPLADVVRLVVLSIIKAEARMERTRNASY